MRSGHTKVCWVVIGWTIKAQSLQIGDEVRDCAFVDTLSLTENVKLQRNKMIHWLENWPYIQVLMMSRTGAPRGKTSPDKTGANWWADAHFLLIQPRTQMKKYLCHEANLSLLVLKNVSKYWYIIFLTRHNSQLWLLFLGFEWKLFQIFILTEHCYYFDNRLQCKTI